MWVPELPPLSTCWAAGPVAGAGARQGAAGAGARTRERRTRSGQRAGGQDVRKEAEVAGDQGVRQDVPPCLHLCAVVGSGSLGRAEASSGTGQERGSHVVRKTTERCPSTRPPRLPLPVPVVEQDAGPGPSWASPSEWARSIGGATRRLSGRVSAAAWRTVRAQRLKHHALHVSGCVGQAPGRAGWALRFPESVGCGHLQAGSAGAAPAAQRPRSSAGFRACGLLDRGPLRHVRGLGRHAGQTC